MDVQLNQSESWSIRENGRILFEYFPINFLSIIANFFIIFLCVRSPELKKQKHSKYFIMSTASLNTCNSACHFLEGLTYSLFYVFDIEVTLIGCTIFHTFIYSSSTCTILSYLSTIVCRYREVAMSKKCSKRLILLLISYQYLAVIPFLLSSWILDDSVVRASSNEFCQIYYSSKFQFPLLSFTIVCDFASLSLQMLLSFKLYRHLKFHFLNVSANLQTNRSELDRLRTEKSILSAILIQGVSPIILITPGLVAILMDRLFGYSMYKPIFKNVTIRHMVQVIYFLNPLIDSWAVLFVMIPYAKARKRFLKQLKEKLTNLVCLKWTMWFQSSE